MSDFVLETEGLCYAYPCGKQGLRELSLHVARHRKLAIVGHNGSGKSTLLLCLSGTLRPQRGAIRLDGTVTSYGHSALLDWRRRVGLVFQEPDDQVVAPSVIQDVAFGPLNLGLAAPAARDRGMMSLASLGIESLADSATHELSHGQKKLVALAGVLAMKPDVILLDEPTAGLDPSGKKKLMGVLDQLHAGGATIVMATHDMDLAYAWADRVAVLKDGATLVEGETQAVFQEAATLEAAGLEMPYVPAVTNRLLRHGLVNPGADIRSVADLLAALERQHPPSSHPAHSAAPLQRAILLVAFGTSVPEAEVAYREIERLCRLRFPETEIRWAFTSKMVRKKLASAGRLLDSPAEALARLAAKGYLRVAVQSLHVIRGQEYDDMIRDVDAVLACNGSIRSIRVGLPLLSSTADIERVSRIMANGVVPAERRPNDAIVWMGHGSRHHAEDSAYGSLAEALRRRDPHSFLGTVEGRLTLESLVPSIQGSGIEKAWLLPFMAVAGDHARNDLAGDDESSWRSELEARGISCVPVLKGIAEYEAIAEVWMDHLADAWGALE
jgi:cobalt/nickel transport system ATP-binding protein